LASIIASSNKIENEENEMRRKIKITSVDWSLMGVFGFILLLGTSAFFISSYLSSLNKPSNEETNGETKYGTNLVSIDGKGIVISDPPFPDPTLTFFPTYTKKSVLTSCVDPKTNFYFTITFEEMENIRKAAAISLSVFLDTQKLVDSGNVIISKKVITDSETGEIRLETDEEYGERCKEWDKEWKAQLKRYEEILKIISRPLIDTLDPRDLNNVKIGG